METWQERMAQRAKEAEWYATLSLACGNCTDEGDEHRPAEFGYSRLDALTVARAGYLGEYAKVHANSRDLKKQREVADFLANPAAAERAGVKVTPDVTENQLGKAEFNARREIGAGVLVETEGLSLAEAKKEWMLREAERMATEEYSREATRDDANEQRRNRVKRIYRNLCNRDRK